MKIYIAGAFRNVGKVRVLRDLVLYDGYHEITYDWTDEYVPKPFSENPEEARRAAQLMIGGALAADLVFVIWHPRLLGGWVEFGAAVGAGKRVILKAPNEHRETIFEHMPNVMHSGPLIRNSCMCRKCGDHIVSRTRHDFTTCKCGAISTDGGYDYIRRLGGREDIVDTCVRVDEPEPANLMEES